MELDWNPRPIAEWRYMLRAAPRGNWLQTITHAKVLKDHLGKYTRIAAIRREGKIEGMALFMEFRVAAIEYVELYRGPIWFCESPPELWLQEFANAFNKEYPKGLLRRRTWLPEWPNSESARLSLKKSGFKPTTSEFETVWIDLLKPLDDIKKSLDPKWRGHLSKGSRSDLDIRIDRDGSSAEAFVHYHELERERKKYKARSSQFLKDEIKAAATFKEQLILWALVKDEPVAGVLILMHGNSGSYRAGWTTDEGRKRRAHHVLLWEALTMLKSNNYRSFDLGGTTAIAGSQGFITFKKGMGGEDFKSLGVYA
jgi:lipid II:glycine glycyltransferase (peptidoglycan interpeptide bridge formation enzyme)